MQSHWKTLILALISMFYVCGCGQKGPLYLPGNTNEISTSIPVQQEASQDDDDEDEKTSARVN